MTELDPRTHARRHDPETSHAAARLLSSKDSMLTRILATYLDHDRIADEATRAAGYEPASGAWKRVSDLAAAGLIDATGERRVGDSGREQIVREITRKGVIALAQSERLER